jgi:hypothetical protein
MSQARLRRIARLEKRALPYIARKQQQKQKAAAEAREDAFIRLANVAILLLYGNPKIGEPLTEAWQRCLQSEDWQAYRAKYSQPILAYGYEATPFGPEGARAFAEYFRQYILPDLPSAGEVEKLNALLAKAPRWLLWFTYADFAGVLLQLNLPDGFDKSRYFRPQCGVHLPKGSFRWRRLPDGTEDEWLSGVRELERKHHALLNSLTPRQRLRAKRNKQTAPASVTLPLAPKQADTQKLARPISRRGFRPL